jgi:hypothetical protein
MRGSRVRFLVAAPSASKTVSDATVSACIYRDISPCFVDTGLGRGQNRASLLGGVPERSKGSDCKSDGSAFVGSNPTPSTMQSEVRLDCLAQANRAANAKVAGPATEERIVSRVWFNGRTSAFQAEGAGSIPATRSIERRSCVAHRRHVDDDPSRTLYCSHSSVGRALPW